MSVKITTVATQSPAYCKPTAEIIPLVEFWMQNQEERYKRKVIKLFEGAGVEKRYAIMDSEEVFTKTSFEEKNNIYKREVLKLSSLVVQKALNQSNLKATEIDYIITVSCTGIMIPSLDAYLINSFEMNQDVVRLPVTEMGCVAGVSGLIYAKNFLQSNANKRALVVSVEAPTATFQLEDYSMTNVVSAAIFGDGAAAVILSSYPEDKGPVIKDEAMYHYYNTTDIMGFGLVNTGLQMILDKTVPEVIEAHFPAVMLPFLEKNNTSLTEVNHYIFHPGGKKIVQVIEDLLSKHGKNIDITKQVLKDYGNMSSATVLFVLERFLVQNPQKGEKGVMLSFGPGFTAQRILLEW